MNIELNIETEGLNGCFEHQGTDANTSLGYCRGGSKMFVFAVLLDRSGITAAQGGGLQSQAQGQPSSVGLDSGDTVEEAKKEVGAGVSDVPLQCASVTCGLAPTSSLVF